MVKNVKTCTTTGTTVWRSQQEYEPITNSEPTCRTPVQQETQIQRQRAVKDLPFPLLTGILSFPILQTIHTFSFYAYTLVPLR